MTSTDHAPYAGNAGETDAGTLTVASGRGDTDRIGVLLANDQRVVRTGLRYLLEDTPDIRVSGEASSGRELLRMARSTPADVAVVDIAITNPGGLEVMGELHRSGRSPRVVIVSRQPDEQSVLRALQQGARAFVLEDSGRSEFELAIRAAARGHWFICPRVASPVIAGYLDQKARELPKQQRLTARQREIMALVADGRTSREIAVLLGRSLKTIEAHRAEIMRRLGVRRMAGIVQEAVRMGLVSPVPRPEPDARDGRTP